MSESTGTLAPVQAATKAAVGVAALLLGTLSITLAGVHVGKVGTAGITGVDWTVPERIYSVKELPSIVPLLHVHYILMTMAVVLSSFAVLSFAILPGNRILRKAIHSSLQGGALLLYTIGLTAAVRFHHKFGYENFFSAHSWIGVIAYVLCGIIWLGSLPTFWVPAVPESLKATSIGPHVFFGAVTYAFLMISAVLGAAHLTDALIYLFGVGYRARAVYIMDFLALTFVLLGVVSLGAAAALRPSRKAEEGAQQDVGYMSKGAPSA